MKKPLGLTAEAIEAALSAYDSQHQEGAAQEDLLEFIKIMSSNDRLLAEMHAAADFVAELDETGLTPQDVRLVKVNVLCNIFFWVGWHSRGALEGAEELNRMMN